MKISSFLRGSARLADFSGTLGQAQLNKIIARSDVAALRSDWEVVGSDIFAALKTFKQTYGRQIRKKK